jgi:endo-beta-N-acetylglucosaminidase D
MQQTAMPVERYRQYQGSHEELLSELTKQGVSLSAVGENSLHIKGEITAAQKEYVRLWKQELIETLSPKKQTTLTGILNRFIEKGITFDVAADEFHFIDTNHTLKLSDMEFLKLNGAAILCQLQQSLLMKHLFSHSPEQFEDFACAIAKREAIMTGDGRESFSIHCEAVKDVSKNWFIRLLKDIAERLNK